MWIVEERGYDSKQKQFPDIDGSIRATQFFIPYMVVREKLKDEKTNKDDIKINQRQLACNSYDKYNLILGVQHI
ncbi:hypothetical protein L1987_61731 [Smallanthus sonchifolius]|uniref:Uncharacterized protein n=1 Tax=Smallanthus sonchifolius TaxID=185202 RepID=A0ACB9C8J6_9ASTR|nr:hypothetical protein L1987_61731 [Smallanthus sonchifolius]